MAARTAPSYRAPATVVTGEYVTTSGGSSPRHVPQRVAAAVPHPTHRRGSTRSASSASTLAASRGALTAAHRLWTTRWSAAEVDRRVAERLPTRPRAGPLR